MEIEFRNNKLQKVCEIYKKAIQQYGPNNAKKLFQRIGEIQASTSIAILMQVHPRCHKLKGDKKDLFSIDLVHPMRLLLKPIGQIEDYIEDGNIKFEKITKVTIWSIEDTHD